jgi:hypothetical protein
MQNAGDYTISTTLSPGGPGTNTYDIQVTRAGQPVDNLDVRIQLVNAALERRGPLHPAEPAGDGLYVAAGAEIARAGEWWALVDVGTGSTTQRAAFALAVREEASIRLTRLPTVMQMFSLLAVSAAIVFAGLPFARRWTRHVDTSPVGILAGALALAAGIAVIVGAIWLADDSTRRTEAALYPSPQIVNTILPDAASLARGTSLLNSACRWSDFPDDLRELGERMTRWRDEELYGFTRDGWRGLPSCAAALTDAQRWDVVNALRAQAP